MFKHILIPLDFSDKNDAAIVIARQLTSLSASRLTLLHVIEAIDGADDEESRGFYDSLESRARQSLARLQLDLANQQIEAGTAVAFGDRTHEIVRAADEMAVDLIVMSSRKLDPASPMQPWPTISHKVALLSSCPVLLVR
jgi:nucleotide-binding universal stress UspA family protein